MLGDLKIEYADPPRSIAFCIDTEHYLLEYVTDGSYYPYKLYSRNGEVEIVNINNWIHQASRGHHSLESVIHLAEAFDAGKKFAYQYTDVQECGKVVYEFVRDRLFGDGYASRFADLFDVECMNKAQIKNALHDANRDGGITKLRQQRFVHVCEKNGYSDLAMSWERVDVVSEGLPEIVPHTAKAVDVELYRQVEKLIKKKYERPDPKAALRS